MSDNILDDDNFDDGGLFDGVDFDAIPDDPFFLPEQTYLFEITKVENVETKSTPGKWQFVFYYSIREPMEFASRLPLRDYMHNPATKTDPSSDFQKKTALSFLKQRFLAFGLTIDEMKMIRPSTIADIVIGREFYGETKNVTDNNDPTRKNVRIVKHISKADFDGNVDLNSGDTVPDFGM